MSFANQTGKTNGLVLIQKKMIKFELGDRLVGILRVFLNFHLKFLIISLSEDTNLTF